MIGFRVLQGLAFLAIGFIFYKIWQKLNFMFSGKSDLKTTSDLKIENLIACSLCKIELPKSMAIQHNDFLYFCCEEHKNNFLNMQDK